MPVHSLTTMIESADIVIVGNGIAGITAALEARRLSPEMRISIITAQSHPTIKTPILKQFATGKLSREQLLVYPAGTEPAQHIHVINARVEKIKSQDKFVCLGNGQGFGYGALLLATGSTPVGLPEHLPGRDFDGVLTPHRLNDYLDLRRRLKEVKEAAVIGGGIHAIETVMSLLQSGIQIHWFIRGERFLPRMLDRQASTVVLESSRRAGARVYTETEAVGIVGKVGAVAGVVTNHGKMIPCQMVLACTGTAPLTTLADSCDVPLRQKHGILVDDQLHTSVHDIYAAGDVAALENPQTGIYERRAHWHAATLQGRVVAAALTGHEGAINRAPTTPFGVTWHATDLGKLSLLTIGNPLNEAEGVECLTDSGKGNYRRLAVSDDRLIGYLSLGSSQPDSLAIKRIIDEELPIGNIKKALLKGDFDARQYFSQQRFGTLHTMITTGKLAEVPTGKLALTIRASAGLTRASADPAKASAGLTGAPAGSSSAPTGPTRVPAGLTRAPARGAPTIDSLDSLSEQAFRTTEPLLPVLTGNSKDTVPDNELLGQESQQAKGYSPIIKSFKSLMSSQPEPTRWVVPKILPEGLIVLSGKQKIGKSWLGLALGLGVACGGIVLGSLKVKRGDVLYLALEDNEHCLQSRLSKLMMPGASPPDGFEYAIGWSRMDSSGVTALEAWIVSHPHARLIIVDSWIQVKPLASQQANTSGYESDYEALIRLKQLADTYHLCILVHLHVYKAATTHSVEELQATTAIAACADGFLTLKQAPSERYATLVGSGREYQDVKLALVFDDGTWKIAEKTPTYVHTLSKERRAIIDTLNENDKPMRPKEIALALGKLDGTIRKMLHEMKASDLIQTTNEGYISLIPKDVDMLNNADNASNGGNNDEDITVYEQLEYVKSY